MEKAYVMIKPSETDIEQFEADRYAMQTQRFRESIEDDCQALEATLRKAYSTLHELMQIYSDLQGFVLDFSKHNPPPLLPYDVEEEYSPSKLRRMAAILNWIKMLLDEYWKQPFPYARGEYKTYGDKLREIEKMSAQERRKHLSSDPILTQVWLLDQIQRKRGEHEYIKIMNTQRLLEAERAKQADAGAKEKEKGKAAENLRKAIEKWVEQERSG